MISPTNIFSWRASTPNPAREASRFGVEVTVSQGDGSFETRKYRGEELVCQTAAADLQKAMIHTIHTRSLSVLYNRKTRAHSTVFASVFNANALVRDNGAGDLEASTRACVIRRTPLIA